MPNIWYHDSKYNYNSDIFKEKEKKRYTVLEAIFVSSYHYHGSWFETTWNLKLKDENGKVVEEVMDTWDNEEKLVGKMIDYNGDRFTVINNKLV